MWTEKARSWNLNLSVLRRSLSRKHPSCRGLIVRILPSRPSNSTERLKTCIESSEIKRDSGSSSRTMFRIVTTSGAPNFNCSWLIWHIKVKKLRLTSGRSMIFLNLSRVSVISKRDLWLSVATICRITLNKLNNKSSSTIFMIKSRIATKWSKKLNNKSKRSKNK